MSEDTKANLGQADSLSESSDSTGISDSSESDQPLRKTKKKKKHMDIKVAKPAHARVERASQVLARLWVSVLLPRSPVDQPAKCERARHVHEHPSQAASTKLACFDWTLVGCGSLNSPWLHEWEVAEGCSSPHKSPLFAILLAFFHLENIKQHREDQVVKYEEIRGIIRYSIISSIIASNLLDWPKLPCLMALFSN
ncbi:hypothetical protein SRHO_G00161590 [Serrasalmus rhombeus]